MQSPVLSLCPSFNSFTSARFGEICDKIGEETSMEQPDPSTGEPENEEFELCNRGDAPNSEEQENDDFEFGSRDSGVEAFEPIFADEIFFNGQIRPLFQFQVFKSESDTGDKPESSENRSSTRLPLRKLLIEDRESVSSSSECDELDGVPEGTYCIWTPRSPVPEGCRKSNSTGSSKRWRLRDLLNRSNSDGKETFVSFTPKKDGKAVVGQSTEPENATESAKTAGKKTGKAKVKPFPNEVSPHRIYIKNRAMAEVDRKKSFLPYRQDLVGFFTNMNGLTKNLHPFAT